LNHGVMFLLLRIMPQALSNELYRKNDNPSEKPERLNDIRCRVVT